MILILLQKNFLRLAVCRILTDSWQLDEIDKFVETCCQAGKKFHKGNLPQAPTFPYWPYSRLKRLFQWNLLTCKDDPGTLWDYGCVKDRGALDLEFSNPAGTGFTGFGQKFRPFRDKLG